MLIEELVLGTVPMVARSVLVVDNGSTRGLDVLRCGAGSDHGDGGIGRLDDTLTGCERVTRSIDPASDPTNVP